MLGQISTLRFFPNPFNLPITVPKTSGFESFFSLKPNYKQFKYFGLKILNFVFFRFSLSSSRRCFISGSAYFQAPAGMLLNPKFPGAMGPYGMATVAGAFVRQWPRCLRCRSVHSDGYGIFGVRTNTIKA